MDVRKTPKDYFDDAMNLIQKNEFEGFRQLVELQIESESHTITYQMVCDKVSSDSDDDTFHEEKITSRTEPALDIKKYGEDLLLEACQRNLNTALYLLQLSHRAPPMQRLTHSIRITPPLLRKILDIVGTDNVNGPQINRNNPFFFCSEDLHGYDFVKDIAHDIAEDKLLKEQFLQKLFINFVDENINNYNLMQKFFENVRKYFSAKSEAFLAVINHCLALLLGSHCQYDNPILFEHLLFVVPEAKDLIDKNREFSDSVGLKKTHVINYIADSNAIIPAKEVTDCYNFFTAKLTFIFDEIQSARKSYARWNGFFVDKNKEITAILNLEKLTLSILSSDTTPLKQFKNIIHLLINERNSQKIIKKDIDNILMSVFEMEKPKNKLMISLFTFHPKTKYMSTALITDEANFYVYNFVLKRLKSSDPQPTPRSNQRP